MTDFTSFEKTLNYSFIDKSLLLEAFTHKSYGYEKKLKSNGRLEFLGDSVLGLIISDYLYMSLPNSDENQMSTLKSYLVSKENFSTYALQLGLGKYMLTGKTSESNTKDYNMKVLCDCFEAVFGAIYVDSSFENTRKIFLRVAKDSIESEFNKPQRYRDPKSSLQQYSLKKYKKLPKYNLLEVTGPEHNTKYTVEISLGEDIHVKGSGRSIKEAEKDCATAAMDIIHDHQGD